MSMNQSEIKSMNLYEKMLAIQQEIPKLLRTKEVTQGKKTFKITRIGDILAAVKPLEAKYRVFSGPTESTIFERKILHKTYITEYGEPKEISLICDTVEMTYRFTNIDCPEEYLNMKTFGTGIDADDKAVSKASSYALKNALIQNYKIEQVDQLPGMEPGEDLPMEENDLPGYAQVNEADMKVEPTPEASQSRNDGMTLAQAREVPFSAGELNGTLGELWDNPETKRIILKYHATPTAMTRRKAKNPVQVEALTVLLQEEGLL